MNNPVVDLIGLRFGRWLVIDNLGRKSNTSRNYYWLCECDCGEVKEVPGENLKRGTSKSCSCLMRDLSRERATVTPNARKHGLSNSTVYMAWANMKDRCYNKNHPKFKDWGGRGIRVCVRWKNSFENFYEDMGDKPSPDLSLERINNDKGYSPDNCKWATRVEQNRNKRNNGKSVKSNCRHS